MGKMGRVEQKYRFGWQVVVRLFDLIPLLFAKSRMAILFAILTLGCTIGKEVLAQKSGKVTGSFYKELLRRDEKSFWNTFAFATGLYFVQCLLLALVALFSWCLYLCFRKNLVSSLHNIYFNNNFYYTINSIDDQGIDNPDQRITQDVEKLCNLLAVTILPSLLVSPFVIGYYTYQTWSTAGGFGVGIIYLYFVIGAILNRILVSPLTKWAAKVEKAEGDFRFKHVSVRNNAEESAFYRAAEFEKASSNQIFDVLWRTKRTYVLWQFPTQALQYFFDYYGGVLSYAIQVFPIFIFGTYDDLDQASLSEKISNNAFYYIYLINSFTRLTDLAMNIGELGGYILRVSEILHCSRREKGIENDAFTAEVIDDLQGRKDLSFSISPSGAGKSSFIRVLAELWPNLTGTVRRYLPRCDYFFVPQRPYLPVGRMSLRKQICFPKIVADVREDDADDETERISKILLELHLTQLIDTCGGLDAEVDFEWQDTLSPGEQQRLSLARVILHEPKVVILDEATSSIDINDERDVYQLLQRKGIHYISTGHRETLYNYHNLELHLGRNSATSYTRILGNWIHDVTDDVPQKF
ncbi:unnamed protein product [Nippostrongylus brasiliensis]|uniref:ABC transporter domain-containing protein n=1 Tax=Nippostrongylus brasiliensis TaxID=27835 RepID=A0A158QX42_NIPBR|nr:unnamed protein product [Nippostrongylus brasiliensis]